MLRRPGSGTPFSCTFAHDRARTHDPALAALIGERATDWLASAAWRWRSLARILGGDHPVTVPARAAADRHIAVSLPHLTDDYMDMHWRATYALLALIT